MGKTLKQLRLDEGLTQEEVALRTDKTRTYICLLENGKRNPSDNMKKQLAKLYNISIGDIFLAIESTRG